MRTRKILVIVLSILAFIGMIITAWIICSYTLLAFVGFLVCWIWCSLFAIANLNYIFKAIDKYDNFWYNIGVKVMELHETITNYFRKNEVK